MNTEIIDKIKSKFEDIDEKNLYYILAGVLLLVFLLDYFILMRPQLGSLAEINPKIKLLKEDITKVNDDFKQLGSYRNEIKELSQKVEKTHLKVKSRREIPLILESISRIASNNGLQIDQIMPVHQDQETLLENNERMYISLPIQIEARSKFHDFGRFLNEIEQESIQLSVGRFIISAREDSEVHSIRLTLNAVVYEEI